jgi:YD repeat-containing protein
MGISPKFHLNGCDMANKREWISRQGRERDCLWLGGGRTLARLLCCGIAVLATTQLTGQSYQTAFGEVKFDRAKTPATFHGDVRVDVPTGYVSVSLPMGPGIGARGVHYTPTLNVRSNPRASIRQYLVGGSTGRWVLPNWDTPDSTYGWTVDDEESTSGSLFPGYFDLKVPVNGFFGPNRITSFDGPGIGGVVGGQVPTGVDTATVLARFGYSNMSVGLEPKWTDSTRNPYVRMAGGQALVLALSGAGFSDVTYTETRIVRTSGSGNVSGTMGVPGGFLVVVGDVAYEYKYAHSMQKLGSIQDPSNGMNGPATILASPTVRYYLTRVKNVHGDDITFSYDSMTDGATSITAVWNRDGATTGASITTTINTLDPAHRYRVSYAGSGPEVHYRLEAATISKLWADGLDQLSPQENMWLHAGITKVVLEETNEAVAFEYGLLPTIYMPTNVVPDTAGGTALTKVKFGLDNSPHRTVSLEWEAKEFLATTAEELSAPINRGRSWFWGVKKVTEQATGAEDRVTTYDRQVPRPNTAGGWDAWERSVPLPLTWTSTTFQTKVTLPDGQSVVHTYATPPATWNDSTPSSVLQRLKYLKHIVTSEEYRGTDGMPYRTVSYDGHVLNTLANPNGDPQYGAVPYPTIITSKMDGITTTTGKSGWSSSDGAWTVDVLNVAGSETWDRSNTKTFESKPNQFLFARPLTETVPGHPTITRTFAPTSNLIVTETLGSGIGTSVMATNSWDKGVLTSVGLTGSGLSLSGLVGAGYTSDDYGFINGIKPAGFTWSHQEAHNMFGWPISQIDPNGINVNFTWDAAGRLTSVEPTKEESTQISYPDPLTSVVKRGSFSTTYHYNGYGELSSCDKGTGESKTFTYDLGGRKVFESAWGSSIVGSILEYKDPRKRSTRSVDPNGVENNITYDGLQKTVILGPVNGGTKTIFTYDGLNRLRKVTDTLNQVTEYDYDDGDRIAEVRQMGDPGTQKRNWFYNALGWLTQIQQPESGTTTFDDFTVLGKPQTTSYAGSKVTTHFDSLGRVINVSSADNTIAQSYAYDTALNGKGKVAEAVDGAMKLAYGYGGLNGRLSSLDAQFPIGKEGVAQTFGQSFDYDSYGHRSSSKLPSGRIQTYDFDLSRDAIKEVKAAFGRPGSFSSVASIVQVTGFNEAYLPLNLKFGNGASTILNYDNDQARLSTMAHYANAVGGPLRQWIYQWDSVTGWLKGDGEDSYTYDDLGRLMSVDAALPGSTSRITQRFNYDAFGNQTESRASSGAPAWINNFAFNKTDASWLKNQLPESSLSDTGAPIPTGRSYSPQGYLKTIFKQAGQSGKQLSFDYDALGRVLVMTDTELGLTEKYAYTPEGLRWKVEEYHGGALTKIRYNVYNDARQLVSQFEWVPSAQPLAKVAGKAIGAKSSKTAH